MKTKDRRRVPSKTAGAALVIIGAGLACFDYAHRPPSGFMDVMERGDTFVFNAGVYYFIMVVSILWTALGIKKLWRAGAKLPNPVDLMSQDNSSRLDEIKQAKELLDAGAITQGEFEQIKVERLR